MQTALIAFCCFYFTNIVRKLTSSTVSVILKHEIYFVFRFLLCFSSYGEGLFLSVQTALIAFCCFYFTNIVRKLTSSTVSVILKHVIYFVFRFLLCFSSYGEGLFLSVQTALIAFCCFYFTNIVRKLTSSTVSVILKHVIYFVFRFLLCFSSYGEGLFLSAQTALIAFCCFYFTNIVRKLTRSRVYSDSNF